jgi:hypothetical protein
MVSPQQAMQLLALRIQALELKLAQHLTEIERKLGEHAAYVTDNIPDLDTLNTAIGEINSRVLDIEEYDTRIASLEAAANVSPPSPPKAPASKKKGGTVKLTE